MKVHIGSYRDDGTRDTNIQIDDFDVWSMDYTLALIIHPMLVKLRETSQGAPDVNLEDVPEELRIDEPREHEWQAGSNHFNRWNWIMDEMIWAFEQLVIPDYEQQFHTDTVKLIGYTIDHEGLNVHEARMKNGYRLFGTYYMSLWA